ncbi:nucleoside triphosphate pyrophosphohydrolase [Alteromonas oceanisediminis]|uniref:nucleoside triphosphate pyrophosphohydrolase n=1 Tax=Alteromonas oceanisediminis TaxID=2836180 RepID=UPI001BDA162F|nr:nucleoside triphosphate pyrophosphohydrolase [Alteromonas oceanisediminis]MBT0585214.1 nucleoside triphosphate pyrophosphohydrolase [Alteromonas oceanisediminis]
MSSSPVSLDNTQRLLEIMRTLRDPDNGCRWDRKQTMSSLLRYTIEEAYEVADAVERGDIDDIHDELGDLLFQVVFYAQIASEQHAFDFDDVAGRIADKLVRRHPHLFSDAPHDLSEDALAEQWQAIKAQEKRQKKTDPRSTKSIFDDIHRGLPALSRAVELQKACAQVGFDWPNVMPVLDKVEEELLELKQEITAEQPAMDSVQEEFGDLLFAAINVARHLNIDAETALRQANLKFEKRFRSIEQHTAAQGLSVDQHSLSQLEALWQRVKSES